MSEETWDGLRARFDRLTDENVPETDPRWERWQQDLTMLMASTPRDQVPDYFRPSSSTEDPEPTAGQYFMRALGVLGSAVGGAWAGGKKR